MCKILVVWSLILIRYTGIAIYIYGKVADPKKIQRWVATQDCTFSAKKGRVDDPKW